MSKTVQTKDGVRIVDVLKEAGMMDADIMAARMNNEYVSLMDRIIVNGSIEPVRLSEEAGLRIYRNSLAFLFEMAVKSLFPNRRLVISDPPGNRYFYQFWDQTIPCTKQDVKAIESLINTMVSEDIPIVPGEISWEDAISRFNQKTYPNTALLLESRNDPCTEVWTCREFMAPRHTPLAASTGQLKTFSVILKKEGFLLCCINPENLRKPTPENLNQLIVNEYVENNGERKNLGVSNAAQLNLLIRNREEARDYIHTMEAVHERKIAKIAGTIQERGELTRAVMIAGPSSSGKTTFTKKLALSLKSRGIAPLVIGLDNYYKHSSQIPRDKKGNPDFEALEALDLELLESNIENLLSGKKTDVPIFKFSEGQRLAEGREVRMQENGVLLFEGIHGLNPNLTPNLNPEKTFKIFVSVLTQMNIDDLTIIPTTDSRLVRRIVRDHQFRGFHAINTIRMWPSVRHGEREYIFKWRDSADTFFNSVLDYEMAVLKPFAEPLLRTVSPNLPEYGDARRLLSIFRNFSPFPAEDVPELSILREFIGRSGFHY